MSDWYEKKTIGSLPERAAARFGDAEALTFKAQRYSFRELAARVDEAAKGLMAIGVQPGDKVCLWLNNCAEWMFFMYGLAKIGAVQVPVNTRFRTADLSYVLEQSTSTTLITHDTSGPVDYLSMVRELLPLGQGDSRAELHGTEFPEMRRVVILSDRAHPGTISRATLREAARRVSEQALAERAAAVDPDETALILYTSGTTGFPKGVMHSHKMLRNIEDRAVRMAITKNDVVLNYLPLFHLFGYAEGALMSLCTGARQVITETFNADECIALIESERATLIHGFETHFKDLCEAQERSPHDLSSLRTGLFAAGMHSATNIKRKAARVLAPIKTLTGYGMSEMGVGSLLSSLDSSEEQRCETSGYPMNGYECRVVHPASGHDMPIGEPGEMIFRGYGLMQGYYRKEQETAASYDAEGWFHTGDMGVMRADGYIRFLGRYKDMLKIGGENVDPMEVEGFLLEHPGVHQVSIVSYPDPRLTEVCVAFVQPKPGSAVKPEDIVAYCKGKIASFKVPRHVFFVEEFPMTASGKVQKIKLREQALRQLEPT